MKKAEGGETRKTRKKKCESSFLKRAAILKITNTMNIGTEKASKVNRNH